MKALPFRARRGERPRRLSARGLDLVIATGMLMCAVAAAVAIGNEGIEHRYLTATVAVLLIGSPLVLGIYAWRSDLSRRFGALLVLGAAGMFVTTLANSGASLPYSVGRLAGWAMEVAIVYVLLAYPTGRLRSRGERLAVGFAAAIVVVLYLPGVLVAESLPTPSPWTGCLEGCPDNAFAIGGGSSVAMDVLGPLREIAAGALFMTVSLLLVGRQRRATPLARTSLTPVLAVAIVRFGGASAFLALRGSDAPTDVVAAAALVMALTVPLIAVGFLVGLVRWRLRTARALERLGAGLEDARGAASLQALLAESLDDPVLRLYLRAKGEWRDADGVPVASPTAGRGRFLLPVEGGEGQRALVACDGATRHQQALLGAVAASVRSTLERQRLTEALAETREEVAASRTRIAASADAERRRIERDIHDGAQQRLIALGIELEIAEDAIERDPADARRTLQELRAQVGDVIDEVRALCHGIYPPLLTAAGPADALRGAALRLPVPVRTRDRGLTRHPEDVESAVFFCCMEAVQNAIKHGGSVGAITIDIEEREGELRFSVSDDGRGFDAGAANGAGITNMRDRLAALEGELTIGFPGEGGTTVSGSIPLPAGSGAQGPNWAIPGGGDATGGEGGVPSSAGAGGGAGGTGATTGAGAGGGGGGGA